MKVRTMLTTYAVLVLIGSGAAAAPNDPTSHVGGDAKVSEPIRFGSGPQLAAEQSAAANARKKASDVGALAPARTLPVYTPPRRGAPKTRVGGGTRQLAGDAVELTVLAPPHTGLTREASPTLYWFLSETSTGPFEFVVTALDAAEPLWRQRVDGPLAAGIHALALHEHAVELAAGVEYQWSVAIVRDPERRSRDVVTLGTVQRVDGAPDAGDLPRDAADEVIFLAERGLWYDALQSLNELSEGSSDRSLDDFQVALLDQAELEDVAEWVRNRPQQPPS